MSPPSPAARTVSSIRTSAARPSRSGTTAFRARGSPLTYARDVRVSPHDPRVLHACLSPATRSEDGSLYRSDDLGETWTRCDRGVKAESTMMAVALHPADPDHLYCTSRTGQVFGTEDGGRTWHEHRLPDGVKDVYALACD
jgi:photosystem II stability/assembly factor-like uncharacterized protein